MISNRALSAQLLLLGLSATVVGAQPATDIYLGTITVHDGRIQIGQLQNITDRDGYDNQPSFTPDGRSLLYTSIRDGQADTYRYDLVGESIAPVTRTPESEYSPTTMPGGARFSVVRVEADSTQRLWHFDMAGHDPGLLLEEVKSVGYHAWYDENMVALFVLGSPPSLRIADIRDGSAEAVAEGIGRSLQRIPSRSAIAFVHKMSEDDWQVKALDMRTGEITSLVSTLSGSEDLAWTPDGLIMMGQGSSLYQWNPERSPDWEIVADLADAGLTAITRIAVSPLGDRAAIVAQRQASERD